MLQIFFIVDTDGPNILGLQGSIALDLIEINCNMQRQSPIKSVQDLKSVYSKQFDKIGNFDGKFHIQAEKNATPIIQLLRKYPTTSYMNLKKHLLVWNTLKSSVQKLNQKIGSP
ncbi:hypothetical protein PoB_001910100 [Plakobranchus ocellatus]|uniref:Uncharacterized protein n=1 Tax=Plakobranchus ocellatus TaxID=259542 RepID=A0AAV3Z9J7_9GAST|nr:hypothetical protein PoB_001910100 [Plakobranchus ocellatus]